jgi:hypothetical protein
MAARSLIAFTGIVSAMLVASMAVAAADLLSPLADAGSQPVQSTAVRFAPEGSESDANHGGGKRQHGLPVTTETQTRIKVVARCGTTNLYCNPPTPVCCGSPGKYYCAKDPSGCNQRR